MLAPVRHPDDPLWLFVQAAALPPACLCDYEVNIVSQLFLLVKGLRETRLIVFRS